MNTPIGWEAVQNKIPFITTLSAASSIAEGIENIRTGKMEVMSLQNITDSEFKESCKDYKLLRKYF